MPPVSGADPFLTSTAPSTSENWPATLVRGSPLSAQDCDLLPPEAHRHIPSPRGPILGPTNRTQPNTTLSATPLRTLAALPTRPPKSHLTRGGEPDTDALRRVRQAVGGSAGAWAVPASAASSSSGQCAHSMRYLGEVTAAIRSSSFVTGQFLRHATLGDGDAHGPAGPTEQGGGAKCLVHSAISNF
jgi:hypothetical protein